MSGGGGNGIDLFARSASLEKSRRHKCHKVADGVAIGVATLAEPFVVALHAVSRAGSLLNKRVLVTGCSPIGTLAVIAARAHGAREIVVTDGVLAFANRIGADRTINVARDPEALTACGAGKVSFDVQFEASGNAAAVRAGLDISIPQNQIVPKEIDIRGAFRFHSEFVLAVDLINRRRVDLSPLLTGSYPLNDAHAVFEVAGDRSRS